MRYECIYVGSGGADITAQLTRISQYSGGIHTADSRKSMLLGLQKAVESSDAVFVIDGTQDQSSARDISRATGLETDTYDGISCEGGASSVILPRGAKPFIGSDMVYRGCVTESGYQSIIILPAAQSDAAVLFDDFIFPFLREKYGILPADGREPFDRLTPKKAAGGAEGGTYLPPEDAEKKAVHGVRHFAVGAAVFCLLALLLCGAFCLAYNNFLAAYAADSAYARLREDYGRTHDGTPQGVPEKFGMLYSVNNSVAGWLKIDGTGIDYPAVYPSEDEDFYENHLFDGVYNPYGCLQMQRSGGEGGIVKNTVITGKNTGDGRMLSELVKFRDIEFYKEHFRVNMDTLAGDSEWVIFAAVITKRDGTGFDYTKTRFDDETGFELYLNEIWEHTFIITPISVLPSDEILTVYTDYSEADGTVLAVMAKRVEPGTSQDTDVSAAFLRSSAEATGTGLPYVHGEDFTENDGAVFLTDTPYIASSDMPSQAEEASSVPQESSEVSSAPAAAVQAAAEVQKPEVPAETEVISDASEPPSPPVQGDTQVQFSVKNQFNGQTVTGDAVGIVAQVIEAEMGSSFNLEALKAQAVATYTYLYYNGAASGSTPSAPMKTAGARCTQAANEVAGLLLKYNGKVCNTTYFAMSAGKTAASADVWGGSLPYLVSVDSSVDAQMSSFETIRVYSADVIAAAVQDVYGADLTAVSDKNTWIQPTYDGTGLYVKSINYGGLITKSGPELRSKVLTSSRVGSAGTLRSHAFTVRYDAASDSFIFTVKGYGHGVGMSQYGANLYAAAGWSFDQILYHYYPGTSLD